jgi:hypothetical protein
MAASSSDAAGAFTEAVLQFWFGEGWDRATAPVPELCAKTAPPPRAVSCSCTAVGCRARRVVLC